MSKFTVTAASSLSSEPFERTAASAAEAEIQLHALLRICGSNAKVEIWGPDNRLMSSDKLNTLACAERATVKG